MRLTTLATFLAVAATQATSLRTKMSSTSKKTDLFMSRTVEPNAPEALPVGHGFLRFDRVTDKLRHTDELFRSSAPHYHGSESDQKLTNDSIKFLQEHNIVHVIAVNSLANNELIRKKLEENAIAYTALLVEDYEAPTFDDFGRAYRAFRAATQGATLVWCAYGHGRTGTTISALQIYRQYESLSPDELTEDDFRKNHVESQHQLDQLKRLNRIAKPERARREIHKAVESFEQAKAAMSRLKEVKTLDEVDAVKGIAAEWLQRALGAQSEALDALNFYWEVDLGIFDKIMRSGATRSKLLTPNRNLIDLRNKIKDEENRANVTRDVVEHVDRASEIDRALRRLGDQLELPGTGTAEGEREEAGREWENEKMFSSMGRIFERLRAKLRAMKWEVEKLNSELEAV
ncbi:hypothetical protein XA68_13388 [Ophiocordyceps unilateralis]|uniref:Swiss Army Knife protein DSP-PTPase phosphatase domain-containing protein n=1 Tax=Ophiocordyceps unilateralis TaxID=268505 RepID=A0A2A9PNU8_OPHUN|nr:hypothetical protein XA68_13388 [Ophiocordyceps unilateralis]